jgi:hypothetical protein
MISAVMPVKSAPITFTSDGKKWSVSIPGVTDVTIEGIAGAGKETVWLDNVGHPASRRLAAARSSSSSYKDHALSFENSGRNGHFSPISWAVA